MTCGYFVPNAVAASKYVSLKPCRICGGLERYIKRNRCVACDRRRAQKTYSKHSQNICLVMRQRRLANVEYYRAMDRKRHARDREKRNIKQREYTAKNIEANRKRARDYYRAYPDKYKSAAKSRIGNLRRATPKWADKKAVQQFYENRPNGFHVDHVVPLNGDNVCGLHVIENLQYLSATDNVRKSNKFD